MEIIIAVMFSLSAGEEMIYEDKYFQRFEEKVTEAFWGTRTSETWSPVMKTFLF